MINISSFQKKELTKELEKNARFDKHSADLLKKITSTYFPLEEILFELSTVRNRNLITWEEQQLLRKTTVGFFGLSVGSHAAITWMMQARPYAIKICDPDTISATNLNRLRFGWETVGKKKIDVVEHALLEIFPFTKVLSTELTDLKTIQSFFDTKPSLDVVIDAIDSIEGKVALRRLAKERNIPIVSAADVGDMVMLDIERYDKHPHPNFFHGRVPGIENINLSNLSRNETQALIIKLVGFEKNNEKMINSLLEIGKTLETWPQLGATAAMAGGVVATVIKKIILGEQVQSGRYHISLDEILVSDFTDIERLTLRNQKVANIIEKMQ